MVVHKKLPDPPTVLSPLRRSEMIICRAFAKGCGGMTQIIDEKNPYIFKRIATYGIKRGSGDAIKRADEYWYIDNGYMGPSKKYYRICHNSLVHNGKGNHPKGRFEKLKLKLNDWRKDGSHIILCPPSPIMERFVNEGKDPGDWTKKTIKEIKKYTDRKIVVSTKYGDGINVFTKTPPKYPLGESLKNAWVLVTYNSGAITKSVMSGIPVISLSPERKIGSLSEIENPILEREFLYTLAYKQWSIEEMKSGQAWRELNAS